jgi:MFS-type transporter involved in bile tolerance (Atg22 family)
MYETISRLTSEQWAWILFDAGCWGYISVTVGTLVPLVFKQDTPEDEKVFATELYANTVAIGTLLSGLLCPIIGAAVDLLGKRKFAVAVSSVATVASLTSFAFVNSQQWLLLVALAVSGMMFYGILQSTYNSILMHVSDSSENELVFMSCFQCVLGNAGAMLIMSLLGLNRIEDRKIGGATAVVDESLQPAFVQQSFALSALWFGVLGLPFFLLFREVPSGKSSSSLQATLRTSWAAFRLSLMNTELMKYMIATLLFSDAASTLDSVYQVLRLHICHRTASPHLVYNTFVFAQLNSPLVFDTCRHSQRENRNSA